VDWSASFAYPRSLSRSVSHNAESQDQAMKQFVREIESQLQDDILNFAWLQQLVGQQNPSFTDAECVVAVVDLVAKLHNDGKIVVGDARETNGMVLIDAWPESNHNLRDRIKSVITESNDDVRDFCFWIQLSAYFAS
jgi:hypothetical protein